MSHFMTDHCLHFIGIHVCSKPRTDRNQRNLFLFIPVAKAIRSGHLKMPTSGIQFRPGAPV